MPLFDIRGIDGQSIASFESHSREKAVVELVQRKVSFRRANLSGIDLSYVNLSRADFSQASLLGANLTGACLMEADLTDCNLESARLSDADLQRAKLVGSNLALATLANSSLAHADLSLTNLARSRFIAADLTGASLVGANCFAVNFSLAKLGNTLCQGADFTHARFDGAKMNWQSHELVSLLLSRAAKTTEQKKVAGFVLISKPLCWRHFFEMQDPMWNWAVGVLEEYGLPGCYRRLYPKTGRTL